VGRTRRRQLELRRWRTPWIWAAVLAAVGVALYCQYEWSEQFVELTAICDNGPCQTGGRTDGGVGNAQWEFILRAIIATEFVVFLSAALWGVSRSKNSK
jgi:hypothetical protein